MIKINAQYTLFYVDKTQHLFFSVVTHTLNILRQLIASNIMSTTDLKWLKVRFSIEQHFLALSYSTNQIPSQFLTFWVIPELGNKAATWMKLQYFYKLFRTFQMYNSKCFTILATKAHHVDWAYWLTHLQLFWQKETNGTPGCPLNLYATYIQGQWCHKLWIVPTG